LEEELGVKGGHIKLHLKEYYAWLYTALNWLGMDQAWDFLNGSMDFWDSVNIFFE
jgi:hypothetical protein